MPGGCNRGKCQAVVRRPEAPAPAVPSVRGARSTAARRVRPRQRAQVVLWVGEGCIVQPARRAAALRCRRRALPVVPNGAAEGRAEGRQRGEHQRAHNFVAPRGVADTRNARERATARAYRRRAPATARYHSKLLRACTILLYKGVEIARGVARCVEKAATRGWVGSGAASGRHEFDRDCC